MNKKGHLNLQEISIFCLDEADRMLDMGFFPDILWVLEKMPNRSQTLLFSATFPDEVLNIAEQFMTDAEHVMSDDLEVDIPEIDLYAVRIGRGNKLWVLGRIIANMTEEGQMLIFSNTKRMVDVIVERLGKFQMKAVGIHGDMPQNKRERILNDFKTGKERIVVATDVAARGLDVDGITVVVNYDLPDDTESFVHRIGRTGRMGRKGEAWSLVSKEDRGSVEKICSTWGLTIPFVETPALPEGVNRDPVRKRDDWDEVADSFGMVRINLDIGQNDLTKRALSDWIVSQAKVPEIVVGEIIQSNDSSEVEIHVAKVAYVIDIIKARDYNGRKIKPVIVES
jgi:ATP-dependent RNA helicase DeaD